MRFSELQLLFPAIEVRATGLIADSQSFVVTLEGIKVVSGTTPLTVHCGGKTYNEVMNDVAKHLSGQRVVIELPGIEVNPPEYQLPTITID